MGIEGFKWYLSQYIGTYPNARTPRSFGRLFMFAVSSPEMHRVQGNAPALSQIYYTLAESAKNHTHTHWPWYLPTLPSPSFLSRSLH